MPLILLQKLLSHYWDPNPDFVYTTLVYDIDTLDIHWLYFDGSDIIKASALNRADHRYAVNMYANRIEDIEIARDQINTFILTPNWESGKFRETWGPLINSILLRVVEDPPYRVVKSIGKGATSNVFLIEGPEGRQALKVITDPKRFEMADREVLVLSHLPPHKNIITMLDHRDLGDNEKPLFTSEPLPSRVIGIFLEYVEGGITLAQYIRKNRLDSNTMINVMSQLVDGLTHLHKNHIVHLDIKPQNIIMKGSVPIIIDYDLACSVFPGEVISCRQGLRGTYNYLAPEMWLKVNLATSGFFRVDIYSLGVTFYYIASNGQLPHQQKEPEKIKEAVLARTMKPLSSGIPELDDLIMRMIAYHPEARPSLNEIQQILVRLIKSS